MPIVEVFPLGPYDTNAVLIGCSRTHQAVLIDAPRGSAPLISERLKALDLSLQTILFTHSHWDHIADAAALQEEFQVPLLVHQEDAANLEEPGVDNLSFPIEIQGARVDGFLAEGQIIKIGDLELEVIHTPGHSPGSVCFYIKNEKLLISGDTLFRGMIGSLALPTSKPELMQESLHKLMRLPEEIVVIPGHGGKTTIGREKQILIRKQII